MTTETLTAITLIIILIYVIGILVYNAMAYQYGNGVTWFLRSFFWPIIASKSLWKTFWEVVKE